MTIGHMVSALLGTVAIGATSFGAAQLLDSSAGRSPAQVSFGTTGTVETTGRTGTGETTGTTGTVETAGTTTTDATTTTAGREPGEDVRGPCDEVENRNDPRCTGAAAADDRSGPGGGDDRDGDDGDRSGHGGGGGDDGDDDRSGSNSGRG